MDRISLTPNFSSFPVVYRYNEETVCNNETKLYWCLSLSSRCQATFSPCSIRCLLTAALLYVGPSANSRGQGTGEFKINLHLSYRGFSGSDSSWAMFRQKHWCQLGTGNAAVLNGDLNLAFDSVWINCHMVYLHLERALEPLTPSGGSPSKSLQSMCFPIVCHTAVNTWQE